MPSARNPFAVLGISPEAEIEVVIAAYKALARKYHPDVNPGVSPETLTKRMVELNWAKEELERDLAGWASRSRPSERASTGSTSRVDADAQPTAHPTSAPANTMSVNVSPQVVSIAGIAGASASFAVTGSGVSPDRIRARFEPDSFDLSRYDATIGEVVYTVKMLKDLSPETDDVFVEQVDILVDGQPSAKAFISIAPVTSTVMAQDYGARVAPSAHVSVDAKIAFGKHRSRTFRHIAVHEPGYLEWMLGVGAGTLIEQQCAQLALATVGRHMALPSRSETRSTGSLPRERRNQPVRDIVEKPKTTGLWGAIRALIPSNRKPESHSNDVPRLGGPR